MFSLRKLFKSDPDPREARRPLWNAVVAAARAPHWYAQGSVPDTLDGRFDMISLVMALVLHRIDDEPAHGLAGVQLTELFVNDMDGQMRQIGFGDMVVGKQVGRMMSALGGRLGAYRAADGSDELRGALVRNLWRGNEPAAAGLAHVMAEVAVLRAALAATPVVDLIIADHLGGAAR
ncbi:ubiquinol-cytochrome C chaperone [Sphingopyxis sp. H038]|uniref:ubiquinol-cytochrome C chaperone family protein n=1 Tax=unclassified Sphingopyxis TaxID=2614943 RepID=UPI000730F399|nr:MULTISPECIES: ubiquinol-cytochrome C chaperone family protein [unclassified Sphingopyxis]KTD99862.1 ubiquinol-cytochrome C chaperone [Sphingopyxis sp. H012]KTE05576.1 ubiquinol-cytochrome C chaperone [Sphingopyxis sp. H093]KTE06947.1 ubiquinol-cytochrome C chaperone [Sphingopyxis sp. H053]KTE18327.1 ubiquinol-cytochrome C chaperone [Sphingopyxis sp. H080]KTE32105.1 ubiquinol-cytochrome C chaperone [Sphingopyxis sp. H038]